MSIKFEETNISMIINKSPLTLYHTLICPDVSAGLSQCLTLPAVKFCISFLLNIEDKEKSFRIGYNSPGALASVNHLHLHLLYLTTDLYIDKVVICLIKIGLEHLKLIEIKFSGYGTLKGYKYLSLK